MARKRRDLSSDDRAIWERVKAGTRPLHPRSAADPEPEAAHPAQPERREPVARPPVSSPPIRPAAPRDSAPHFHLPKKEARALRRGKAEPEARLDLHGMTAARAHQVLTGFILRAHGQGLRLVLIITGKGRGRAHDSHAPPGQGVLRYSVPRWLASPPLSACVLDVATAHRNHGGEGALYVHLRRKR